MTIQRLVLLIALGAITCAAQLPNLNPFNRDRSNQPAQGAAPGNAGGPNAANADVDPDEGTIESYLELRAFAEGLYNQLEGTDESPRPSAFKRRVDAAWDEERRKDQELAYRMNTSAKSEVKHVIEDRFRVYSGLYDNPIVQALVNRVGQSVVGDRVPQLYTFKLIADPVPKAEALSTGTVWITTGLLAMMKTKAELAYVLAHEAAHVYLQHHKQRLLLDQAEKVYNEQLSSNGVKRAKRLGLRVLVASVATSAFVNPAMGNVVGAVGQNIINRTADNTRLNESIEWNRFEEDEADRLAFDWLMQKGMDVEQVPSVFSRLQDLGGRDPGVTLGFLGRSDRIRERLLNVRERLESEKKKAGWANRIVEVNDPDFTELLAEVQRDNGVAAFHYDMLETARTNLTDAVAVKTQDATVLYFYAKVLMQTAKTEQERNEAETYFRRAAEHDHRNYNYGNYLHRAIGLLTKKDASPTDKAMAVDFLKQYVLRYHMSKEDDNRMADEKSAYPPHLETVYDYLGRAGEFKWKMDQAALRQAGERAMKGLPIIDPTPPRQPQRSAVPEPAKPASATKPPAAKKQ